MVRVVCVGVRGEVGMTLWSNSRESCGSYVEETRNHSKKGDRLY